MGHIVRDVFTRQLVRDLEVRIFLAYDVVIESAVRVLTGYLRRFQQAGRQILIPAFASNHSLGSIHISETEAVTL
jgi:hypothetical protein